MQYEADYIYDGASDNLLEWKDLLRHFDLYSGASKENDICEADWSA